MEWTRVQVDSVTAQGKATQAAHAHRSVQVKFAGAQRDFWRSFDRPGMRIRLKVKELEQEIGLASMVGEPFEVLIELDSPLGKTLPTLAAGATVECTPAFGAGFPLADFEGHHLYLVGHGAGLGPIRTAVLYALSRRSLYRSLHVLVEAHYLNELPYRSEYPAWQRGGARLYQSMQRPDIGKWRDAEAAYVYEQLANLNIDNERSVVVVSGPDDLLSGVQSILRKRSFPPENLYLSEVPSLARLRASDCERPQELLDKVSTEARWGSGHECDVPDHQPVFERPTQQPEATGVPAYKRNRSSAASH